MKEGRFFSTLAALHKRQVCFVYEWCKRTCFEELETIEGNWWPLDLKKKQWVPVRQAKFTVTILPTSTQWML